jgi:hypothetical protein
MLQMVTYPSELITEKEVQESLLTYKLLSE